MWPEGSIGLRSLQNSRCKTTSSIGVMFLPRLLFLDLRISRLMIRFPSCVIVGKAQGLREIPK